MLKQFSEMVERHGIGIFTACELLGPETAERVRLLIRIDELLHSCFSEDEANRWLYYRNNYSPLGYVNWMEFMLKEGSPGMVKVVKVLSQIKNCKDSGADVLVWNI